MYLEAENRWVPSYELIKRELCGKWSGTSADRRAREIAEAGEYKLNGRTYQVESRKSGKYAEFRIVGKTKKIIGYDTVLLPDNRRVAVPKYG